MFQSVIFTSIFLMPLITSSSHVLSISIPRTWCKSHWTFSFVMHYIFTITCKTDSQLDGNVHIKMPVEQ